MWQYQKSEILIAESFLIVELDEKILTDNHIKTDFFLLLNLILPHLDLHCARFYGHDGMSSILIQNGAETLYLSYLEVTHCKCVKTS